MPDHALIPRRLRVPAAVAAGLAAAVVLALGVRYAGADGPGRVDGHLDRAVDALPGGGGHVARVVTTFGSPPLVVVAALGIALGCLLCRRPRAALLAAAGPGLTGVATTLGKPVVDRTIGPGLAFPSGHTGGATSLALVVALLAASAIGLGATGTAVLAGVGAVVAGGAVGTGMVVLGAHYPTDVIGGFGTAVAAVVAVALALDAAAARLRRRTGPVRLRVPQGSADPGAAGHPAGRPSR